MVSVGLAPWWKWLGDWARPGQALLAWWSQDNRTYYRMSGFPQNEGPKRTSLCLN